MKRSIQLSALLTILLCIYMNAAWAQIPCPTGASITSNNFCIYIQWASPISTTLLDSTKIVYVPGLGGNKVSKYAFQQIATNNTLIDVFKDTSGQGGGGSCNANTNNISLNSLAGAIIKFLIGNDTIQCLIASPLPVQMVSFNVYRRSATTADIQWITAQEENINYFSVQRSLNAIDWQELSKYNPQNDNSTTTHTYDYIDQALPTQAKVYYRIVTTDYNGYLTDSKVATLNITTDADGHATVYPTVTTGSVTIQTSDVKSTCSITSMLGQIVQVPIDDEGTVKIADMSSLAAGMYLLNIQSSTGDHEVVKLMKY
ncbi:T9SS type A sorting domain-containing protein [Taibaiella soli]|nr:T9SS type A sorting domain-containing protein [Taibaiella soli]